jgi:hypothetical protein
MSETPDIPDEVLMAYVDGELPPAEQAAVIAALERDPGLRQRLECFSFTRGPMAQVYDETLLAPMPPRLLAAAGVDRPLRPREPERAGLGWVRRFFAALAVPVLSPAAAIPAVVVAAAAGWFLQDALRSDGVSLDGGGIVASASLQSALDTTPTGKVVSLGGDLQIMPKLTFATMQNTWCRQYELIVGEHMHAGGLACLEQGAWKVIVQTAATRRETVTMSVPAGHADILEPVRESLKMGEALSPDQEQLLMRDHWPPPR